MWLRLLKEWVFEPNCLNWFLKSLLVWVEYHLEFPATSISGVELVHWFSMPVGPFWLAAIGLANRGPTKDRWFCIYHLSCYHILTNCKGFFNCWNVFQNHCMYAPPPLCESGCSRQFLSQSAFPWTKFVGLLSSCPKNLSIDKFMSGFNQAIFY